MTKKHTAKDFETMDKISQNIKYEIENSGKLKKDIARQLGVTRSTISEYLAGKALPSLIVFKKLCEILDVSSDSILDIK